MLFFSKTTPVADAQACEAKSRRSDAGHRPRVISVRQRAVFHLACLGARFIPKKVERAPLDFVQQLFVSTLVRRPFGLNKPLL
jgi:hypothetical protein